MLARSLSGDFLQIPAAPLFRYPAVAAGGSDGRETDSVRLCIAVGRTGAPAGFESTRIGAWGCRGGACRGLRTNGLCRGVFDLVRERGDADVLNKSIELLITSRSGRGVC